MQLRSGLYTVRRAERRLLQFFMATRDAGGGKSAIIREAVISVVLGGLALLRNGVIMEDVEGICCIEDLPSGLQTY